MHSSVLLICAGGTRESRKGGFPQTAAPLDAAIEKDLPALAASIGKVDSVHSSPVTCATATAAALDREVLIDSALREPDYGSWAGKSFDAVMAETPQAFVQWLHNPFHGTPDGENWDSLERRTSLWLEGQRALSQRLAAITHPLIIRLLIAKALQIDPTATLGIDIAPLSRTRLSYNGRWRLQAIENALRGL